MMPTLLAPSPVSKSRPATPSVSSVAPSGDDACGWIERTRTEGIDRLRALLSWSFRELVQLTPGPLHSRVFRFVGPGLDVEGGVSNRALRAVGTVPSGRASVTFLLTSHGRLLVDACAVGAGTALSWVPGTDFQCVAPAGSRWVTVSTPVTRVEDLLPAPTGTDPRAVPARHARMPLRIRHALAALLQDLDAWGAPGTGQVEVWEARRLTGQATELLTWALRSCVALPEPSVHDLHAAEVVHGAERYLAQHLQEEVYVRDVCTDLGVAGRTIEDSFHTILGISPMHYLEILRAHAVFRTLRSTGSGAPSSVHEAELRAGVRHGARFAARYRALFGENPADTLRHARGVREVSPEMLALSR